MVLYPWQKGALAKWKQRGCRGIVEAVTGTGKTRVGLAAIEDLARADGYRYFHPLVVVPTDVLMNQWHEQFLRILPGVKVGRISKDHKDTFACKDVCIGIINSVVKTLDPLLEHARMNPGRFKTMLIADECHHYITAPVFSNLLRYPFDYTLGLSATVESPIDWRVQGLGEIVYEYGFTRAWEEGLIPSFDLVNCTSCFTTEEKADYLKLTKEIKEQFATVMELYGDQIWRLEDEHLFRKLKQLMRIDEDTDDPNIRRLFIMLFKRAAICHRAKNKIHTALMLILLMLKYKKKVLVYFERIESLDQSRDLAREMICLLNRQLETFGAPWCKVYHSEMGVDERRSVLEEFRQPGAKALLSCRALDEGLDIPEVDCAIIAASTQSRRQRIQRIGRVLRKTNGPKRSTIITLYVEGAGDEGVCEGDEEIFRGPATLHRTRAETCAKYIESLWASRE